MWMQISKDVKPGSSHAGNLRGMLMSIEVAADNPNTFRLPVARPSPNNPSAITWAG